MVKNCESERENTIFFVLVLCQSRLAYSLASCYWIRTERLSGKTNCICSTCTWL